MKKQAQQSLLAALVLAASIHQAMADAPTQINITGTVIASPCTVDTANSNLNVDLGNIPATTLATAGSSSSWTPGFNVKMKDCPASTTRVTLTLSGTADTANPNSMYRNGGGASNTAVEIQGMGGELMGNGKSLPVATVAADHTALFTMKARAYTQTGNVMPGTISTVVQASFTYQ